MPSRPVLVKSGVARSWSRLELDVGGCSTRPASSEPDDDGACGGRRKCRLFDRGRGGSRRNWTDTLASNCCSHGIIGENGGWKKCFGSLESGTTMESGWFAPPLSALSDSASDVEVCDSSGPATGCGGGSGSIGHRVGERCSPSVGSCRCVNGAVRAGHAASLAGDGQTRRAQNAPVRERVNRRPGDRLPPVPRCAGGKVGVPPDRLSSSERFTARFSEG